MMEYGFEGKTVLVTGGTSGIGLAAAKLFWADGAAKVFILGRSLERGEEALSLISRSVDSCTGGECGEETEERLYYVQADVARVEDCHDAAALIGELAGKIDVLVNCAGIYEEKRLENVTEADYARMMDTNVKGAVFMTQACQPLLGDGAVIVNVASDAGVNGNYGCPLYCASKGALVTLTKALALDMAPSVRVNCVCPADVDTPLVARQLDAADGGYTREDMGQSYPMGRIARPEEVAHVIGSVASPANSFMTGSVILVDGGLTAQ